MYVFACMGDFADNVYFIQHNGQDVSALHCALAKGNLDVVEFLLENKQVRYPTRTGTTTTDKHIYIMYIYSYCQSDLKRHMSVFES